MRKPSSVVYVHTKSGIDINCLDRWRKHFANKFSVCVICINVACALSAEEFLLPSSIHPDNKKLLKNSRWLQQWCQQKWTEKILLFVYRKPINFNEYQIVIYHCSSNPKVMFLVSIHRIMFSYFNQIIIIKSHCITHCLDAKFLLSSIHLITKYNHHCHYSWLNVHNSD